MERRKTIAGLTALLLAGWGTVCFAVDSMIGLASAFRPQRGADAPQGNAARAEANEPGLRVIVSGKSRAVASIDGQIVHVGDTVNGMRVTRISAQGVVLTGEDGVAEQLLLNPSAVKRKPAAAAAGVSKGAHQ